MGFEPFIPPKRIIPKESSGSRDDRVLNLAKMLHERGITSSLTDAKRLAEGMVDVEKKVMKPAVKEEPRHEKAEAAVKRTFGLRLPEDFAHFVAQAAAISHEEIRPSVSIPTVEEKPMSYGREETQTIASVPHVHAHKQMFFEDAPDLSKARGFQGTDVKNPAARTAYFKAQTPVPVVPDTSVVRVSTGDDAVKVTRVETTPTTTVVEEKMVVAEPEPVVPPAESARGPTAAELLAEDLKDAPEKTEELPKTEPKPRETVDLAKQHGVDLFQMFKKKT